jgi:hypothetical protein
LYKILQVFPLQPELQELQVSGATQEAGEQLTTLLHKGVLQSDPNFKNILKIKQIKKKKKK